MTRTTALLTTLAFLGLLLSAGPVLAGKPGGKPGGGGGEDPPAEPPSPEIAYSVSRGDKVMVMDANGGNPTLVVRRVSGFTIQPAWSSDGNTLIFNSTMNGTGIYAVSASGGSPSKLTSTSTQYLNRPVWSPVATADDSEKILFEDHADNGSRDLFLMNTDGTGRVNLTDTPDVDEKYPTWSPDAKQVAAIASFNDGNGWGSEVRLYDLDWNAAGTALELTKVADLTEGTTIGRGDLAFLDWGRVDDQLAVSRYDAVQNDWDIWLVDALGVEAPSNLTNTTDAWERIPTWSPDDTQIAYWHDAGDAGRGVYVLSSNGGTPTVLASDGTAPDWKRGSGN